MDIFQNKSKIKVNIFGESKIKVKYSGESKIKVNVLMG